MSNNEGKRIAGKTFRTPDPDDQLDPALVARALAAFEEIDRQRAAAPPDTTPAEPLPERFHDDMIGTEYEPWVREVWAERERKRQQQNKSGD
ncbi:hypothetical protein ACFWF7_24120 [Nocardia sp. NPDC060256]|uniref:hypothetical protein n=1 Tax=unclassified Nocardia TaxID=2637762 RepID=UPI00364C3724